AQLGRSCRRDSPGRSSWYFALPGTAGKRGPAPVEVGRTEIIFCRERRNQPVVGSHIFEDPSQKSGLARGRANLAGANAGYGEKAAEPFGVARDERKGLNRKPFCLLPGRCRALFHLVNLPFRNKSALPCRSCP